MGLFLLTAAAVLVYGAAYGFFRMKKGAFLDFPLNEWVKSSKKPFTSPSVCDIMNKKHRR